MTRSRRTLLAAVTTLAVASVLLGTASTGEANGATRITICHATGSGGYTIITPSASSLIAGHGHHGGDIIPEFAFDRGKDSFHFVGKNLGPIGADGVTGQAILANGCRRPAPTTQAITTETPATETPTTEQTVPPQPSATAVPPTRPATGSTPTPTPATTAVPGTRPTTTAVPPTQPAAPTPTPATTAVPGTRPTTTAVPPTQPTGPTPTPATVAVPPTVAPTAPLVPPTAPLVPPTLQCPDGEFAHEGSCFPIPPLRIDTLTVPTVTGRDGGPTPTPIAECVSRQGDEIVTWFGYEFDAPEPVRIERGADNSLSPNGRPPTLFGPGIHPRLVSAVSTDGVASWTLGAVTATSDSSTPDCDTITDITTTHGSTTPGPTRPETTPPDTSQPDSTEPATTEPATTEPATTERATTERLVPGGCAAGERDDDGECVPVEPVELVLVDNYLECDGHGVARFAAFNTNGFALGGDGFSSAMAPQRLTALAPQVIGDEVIASDDDRDLVEFVDVRYVSAVTWTVVHDGLESTVSAGVGGARSNPACPTAHVESIGLHGATSAAVALPVTGSDTTEQLAIAALLMLIGGLAVFVGRREPDADDLT